MPPRCIPVALEGARGGGRQGPLTRGAALPRGERFDRIQEEASRGRADLEQLAAATQADVESQQKTVDYCAALYAYYLSGEEAPFTLQCPSLHVKRVFDNIGNIGAEALGALEQARLGYEHYQEHHLRASAALEVLRLVESRKLVVPAHGNIRAFAHRAMRGVLEELRVAHGVRADYSAGVESAYAALGSAGLAGRNRDEVHFDDDDEDWLAAEEPPLDDSDSESDGCSLVGDDDCRSEHGADCELSGLTPPAQLPPSAQLGLGASSSRECVPPPRPPGASAQEFVSQWHPTLSSTDWYELDPAPESLFFPLPLTEGMHNGLKFVNELLTTSATPDLTLVITRGSETVYAKDARMLKPCTWAGDAVLNMTVQDLCLDARSQDVHLFKTLTYARAFGANESNVPDDNELLRRILGEQTVDRGAAAAKAATILNKKRILCPMHVNSKTHWALGCINLEERRFEYLDSQATSGREVPSYARRIDRMKRVLSVLHLCARGTAVDLGTWARRVWVAGREIAAQSDGHSCGLHLRANLISLSLGTPILSGLSALTPAELARLRQQILAELRMGIVYVAAERP